jgi:hypothetical protein
MSQWLGHTKRSAHSPNHFRPFDDSFRPTQKIFDRIRPFSSWASNEHDNSNETDAQKS